MRLPAKTHRLRTAGGAGISDSTVRRLRPALLTQPGWVILISIAMLYSVGLLCIYATEFTRPGIPINTVKQIITMFVGCGVALFVLRIGYPWFIRHAALIVILALIALIPLVLARFISFGDLIPNRRGSHRWIQLPWFQLQPSEFMKVAYIIGLAAYLRFRRNYRTFKGLLIPVMGSVAPMFLIMLEPDLGTVILMLPVLLVMLYVAGARGKHLIALGLIAAAVAPIAWTHLQPYQRSRILGVVLQSDSLRRRIIKEPDKYALLATQQQARRWEVDSGMQLLRSKAALGSGGLTGEGWGNGTYVEYNFLPDRHNDFIFAIIGHQWGLVGCLFILVCYAIIVMAGVEIAASTTEPFARLLAVGVVALISTQVTINVGMTLGLMPITGMTLPFVSYGGSSLVANMVNISLLISVSRYRPYLLSRRPFEFDRSCEHRAVVRPARAYKVHR